jgi:succinate dehydrogenase / fumarate reductase, iron-sulfur subunit
MHKATVKVFRGTKDGGEYKSYEVPIEDGMVVLDAVHYIQANFDPQLAVRWNCKAAKCGSCSAEVNGKPSLMCKTRMDRFAAGEEITVQPLKTFPLIKDLVTDVSWNYEVNKKITPFTPAPNTDWTVYQEDIDRVQEFRKCIECFLCQDVCHVLRDHNRKDAFMGP